MFLILKGITAIFSHFYGNLSCLPTFVLLYVFTFLVRVVIFATISASTMFGSSLPSTVCKRGFCVWFAYSGVKYILITWVTWWLSYKRKDMLTLREHLLVGSVLLLCLVSCFVFSLSSSCVRCVKCLWIVHSWLPFGFSLTFISSTTLLTTQWIVCKHEYSYEIKWIYQKGNQRPLIERQTIQWPKGKGQTVTYKTLHRRLTIRQHDPKICR